MQEVSVGDQVLAYDITSGTSSPTKVTEKFDNGKQECFLIRFSDGQNVVAAGEHPFPIKVGSGKRYSSDVRKTKVKDMIPRLSNVVSKRTRMLSPTTVTYLPGEELPIDPYALGAMLGDGSMKTYLRFHSQDDNVASRVIDGLEDYLEGVRVEASGKHKTYHLNTGIETDEQSGRFELSSLKHELKQLGLLGSGSGDKFIPQMYLSASVEDRRQLLAGLIDTDGFLYGFTVKSPRLAEDFQVLVRGLGGKATIQEVQKTCTNTGVAGTYYNVYWRAYNIPCELTYKCPEKTKRNCDYSNRIVRAIESTGEQQTYCIEIDHPDHCFLIGDFIATCNSDQGAYECVLAITGQHPYRKFPAKGKGWIVGLDYNMVRDVNLPKFNKLLPRNYTINSTFNKSDNIWYISGDGREWIVQFKSSDSGQAKFQGDAVDFIWFDEEPTKTDIFNECMMRLIDSAGIWWMTATPVNGTAWLKTKTEEDDVFVTSGAMWDNPYIPLEEVQKKSDKLSEDEQLVRIEGKYIVFGGSPVFNIRLLSRMIEDLKQDHSTYEIVFDAEAAA